METRRLKDTIEIRIEHKNIRIFETVNKDLFVTCGENKYKLIDGYLKEL
jgi:hypothetical protein